MSKYSTIQTLTSFLFRSRNMKSWLTRQCASACEYFRRCISSDDGRRMFFISLSTHAQGSEKNAHQTPHRQYTKRKCSTCPTQMSNLQNTTSHTFWNYSRQGVRVRFLVKCAWVRRCSVTPGCIFFARWCVRSSLRCWLLGHLPTALFDNFHSFRAPTYSAFRHFSAISSAYIQHFSTLFTHFERLPAALSDTSHSFRAPTYSTFRHFSLISSAYLQHFPTLFSHFECLPTALFDTFQSIRAPTYNTFRHFSAISSTYIQHFSTHFSHFEHLPTALFNTFPQFSGISSHVGGRYSLFVSLILTLIFPNKASRFGTRGRRV